MSRLRWLWHRITSFKETPQLPVRVLQTHLPFFKSSQKALPRACQQMGKHLKQLARYTSWQILHFDLLYATHCFRHCYNKEKPHNHHLNSQWSQTWMAFDCCLRQSPDRWSICSGVVKSVANATESWQLQVEFRDFRKWISYNHWESCRQPRWRKTWRVFMKMQKCSYSFSSKIHLHPTFWKHRFQYHPGHSWPCKSTITW